jgi:hypothetical protein
MQFAPRVMAYPTKRAGSPEPKNPADITITGPGLLIGALALSYVCVYVENTRYAAMLLDEHYVLLFCILKHWRSPGEGVSIPR